jgi:hypothetical protein
MLVSVPTRPPELVFVPTKAGRGFRAPLDPKKRLSNAMQRKHRKREGRGAQVASFPEKAETRQVHRGNTAQAGRSSGPGNRASRPHKGRRTRLARASSEGRRADGSAPPSPSARTPTPVAGCDAAHRDLSIGRGPACEGRERKAPPPRARDDGRKAARPRTGPGL